MNSSASSFGTPSSEPSPRRSGSRQSVGIRQKVLATAQAAAIALLVSFGGSLGAFALVLFFAVIWRRVTE